MKACPTCKSTYPQDFAVCPRDGTPLQEAGVWSEGTVIRGKYRILRKVGQGGMGAVYKALHLRFNELRALKVISVALANDSNLIKRFEKEAVLARKLQHPNAVRVDDIDEAEDARPFIVMEYIEGRSLKEVIQDQKTLSVARVLALTKQVASALSAAHELGIVHRDIKPENIFLVETSGGERAKVLDFGIAKIKEAGVEGLAGSTLTQTGVIIGSPPYMSPEQAMGMKGDQLDARSDLYSLGVVMYQMLTGTLPLKADTTLSMLMAHIQTPPIPIHEARPDLPIPDVVSGLVMQMLEKKPESRPPSARAVIDRIAQAEEETAESMGATIVAPPALVPDSARAPRAPAAGAQRMTSLEPLSARASARPDQPVLEPRATELDIEPASAVARPDSRKAAWWRPWVLSGILLFVLAGIGWGIYANKLRQAFDEYHRIGHELMKQGDWDGAIREYRKALGLRPDLDHIRLDLALALEAKGERRAAFEEFEVVCTRSPNLRECREDYQRLMRQLKEVRPRP